MFLSAGLLGLAGYGYGRRSHGGRSGQECVICRRRRRVRMTLSGALSAVVLAGSGLWLHQHATESTLQGCETSWALEEGRAAESPDQLTHPVWGGTRRVITAPITGIAYHYADSRGGGLCAAGSITVGFVPSAAGDTGLTVGEVFLTGVSDSEAQDLVEHESSHVTQWALLTLVGGPLALPVLYAVDETFFPEARNHFERAAGLEAGGYTQPDGFGPQPRWVRVCVIGLLLLVFARRHLRWGSRVLLRGRAAAQDSERDRCALHSRGWFRLQAACPPSR